MRIEFLLILFALLNADAVAQSREAGSESQQSSRLVVGSRHCDVDGGVHRLGLDSGTRSTTIVFLNPDDAVCRDVAPQLNAIHRSANRQRTRLFGVISSPSLSLLAARAARNELHLEFPVLWDSTGSLAERLRPTHTPEVFVLDAQDRIAYRGWIVRPRPNDGLRQDAGMGELHAAIGAVAAGLQPSNPLSASSGSKFDSWGDYTIDPADLTFNRHIAPILTANCARCHRKGGIGKFAVDSYRGASRGAVMLAYVCSDRSMPPWSAEPGFGRFREERLLSEREINLLSAWSKSPLREGEPSDRLPSLKQPSLKQPAPQNATAELGERFTVGTREIAIPAGAEDYSRHVSMDVPVDMQVMDVTPRMRHIGASAKVIATTPEGVVLPIIHVDDWTYRWRMTYTLLQPLRVPQGSRIDVWFEWNNGWSNPNNEKAGKQTVGWGPENSDEIAEVEFRFAVDEATDRELIISAVQASWRTPQPIGGR